MQPYGSSSWADAAAEAAAGPIARSVRSDKLKMLGTGIPRAEGKGEDGCLRAANLLALRAMIDDCRALVFPGFFDAEALPTDLDAHVRTLTGRIARNLGNEVLAVLRYQRKGGAGLDGESFARHVVERFLSSLPEVRELIALDVQAAYDGDPAAEHLDEVILCYPGLEAIFVHRVSHVLYELGVPILPRVISEQAHSRTGIDIHPGAHIGESFFMDHGSATVIGETSIIGKQVKIYQGVTLGARSFPKDERGRAIKGLKRHPTIGDRVTIYAGAVILGGDTVIGDDCVIAGGVFVTGSVPAGHVVQQTRPELVLKPTSGSKGSAKAQQVEDRRVGWLEDGEGI